MTSHISYDQLLEIISWGILSYQVKGIQIRGMPKFKKISGAMYGGVYTGSPGRDVFLMLPYLNDEQMQDVAHRIADKWPTIPPNNHVNTAACIRFIYGQLEKNGCLRSKADFVRMKKEMSDWTLPHKFAAILEKEFKQSGNHYGLCILYEMQGHRFGDEALLREDNKMIEKMEEVYCLAVKHAFKCKSYKQVWTPFYWAAKYFMQVGQKKEAIKYCKLTLENANKYCPDARQSYIDKIATCIRYLKIKDKDNYKKLISKYKKSSKKAMRQAVKQRK